MEFFAVCYRFPSKNTKKQRYGGLITESIQTTPFFSFITYAQDLIIILYVPDVNHPLKPGSHLQRNHELNRVLEALALWGWMPTCIVLYCLVLSCTYIAQHYTRFLCPSFQVSRVLDLYIQSWSYHVCVWKYHVYVQPQAPRMLVTWANVVHYGL